MAFHDWESLKQFVAAIHEQLSIEHKQWLDASVNTAASLAKLDQALAEAKSKSTATAHPAALVIVEQRQLTQSRRQVRAFS